MDCVDWGFVLWLSGCKSDIRLFRRGIYRVLNLAFFYLICDINVRDLLDN